MHLALTPGSSLTIPLPPAPVLNLSASATPSTGLANGQSITVSWHGYTAGKTVNILECAGTGAGAGGTAACGFTNALLLHPDPTGSGTAPFKVITGPVGNGVCDHAHPCTLVVNNAGSANPKASVRLTLVFAP